jgi:sugar lactone lactonase YvrE
MILGRIDPPPGKGVNVRSRRCAKPSIAHFGVSRFRHLVVVVLLLALVVPARGSIRLAPGWRADVVVTGVGRPIQVALDGRGRLVVLGHGRRGDVAAEILWLDTAGMPLDASRAPRLIVPYADEPRKTALGSLVVDPRTGDLYVGEENGNRVYRLGADHRLQPVAVGLQHLLGGSTIALDAAGRLAVLDFASPETRLRSETPPPPALDSFAADDYQGPLVFRVVLDASPTASPRRLDLVPPVFPRGWARPAREPLTRFMSLVAVGDELVILDSIGQLLVLTPAGQLRPLVRLPAGHFHRPNLARGPDGSIFVSAGFHVRQVYRVTPAGVVESIADELGDPGGLAVDREGRVYVPETAHHRVVRLAPAP